MDTGSPAVPTMSEAGAERVLAQHTPPPATASRTTRPFPRSCFSCNSKKIRCDRKQPCSTCIRAGRTCEFPPAGPRIRRTRQTIIADMSSRLADLEKNLVKSSESSESSLPPSWGQPVATSRHQLKNAANSVPQSNNGSRGDIVVQKGSASQYFNEILISRAMNEVRKDTPG